MVKFILKGTIGTVDIIELQGALVEKSTLEIRDKLMDRLRQGITDVIFLCEQFKQVDSSAVSLFIEISDCLHPRGGKLHFVSCPLSIMIPMKSLGMINFFQFYKTEQEAMQILKISREEVSKVVMQKAPKSSTQTKRQVAIKDHVRNKMILFKHYDTALIKDVLLYLQSTYAHFRDRELELTFHGKRIAQCITLEQLFLEHGYSSQEMLEIDDITPEPPNFNEMARRGGKLYEQAILEILLQQGMIEQQQATSVKQIADLNQESVVTTIIEGDYLSTQKLLQTIAAFFKWEAVNILDLDISQELIDAIPNQKRTEYCVIPIRLEGQKLWVAMDNPLDERKIETLQKITRCSIIPVFALGFAIKQKLENAEITLHEKQEIASATEQDLPMPQDMASGYFGVATQLPSVTLRNLQEYSLEGSFVDFLEESMSVLRRLEKTWKLLQKFAHQVYARAGIDAILEVILDTVVSIVPVEHGIFVMDLEDCGELKMRKFAKLQEYQSLSDQDFQNISSSSLIAQVKKTRNIIAGRNEQDHSIHLAIPFTSHRGKLLGLLYLISPKEHGIYDVTSLKPLIAMFAWGATIIENEILLNKIKKMEMAANASRKN